MTAHTGTTTPVRRPGGDLAIASRSATSLRRIAVYVGVLFVLQIALFAVGSSLVAAYLDEGAGEATLVAGVLLEMAAGLAVVAIGLLMYRVLRLVDTRLAVGYPAMRITEFVVSAALAVYLLTRLEEFPDHLLWVYIPTGIGGVLLNHLMLRHNLVPRPIALLGLVGYTLLLLLVPLDLLGIVDESSGAGLALLAPGGLYEFLVLPAWLITKGFRLPAPRRGGESGRPAS
jgi:hypothetical protein